MDVLISFGLRDRDWIESVAAFNPNLKIWSYDLISFGFPGRHLNFL